MIQKSALVLISLAISCNGFWWGSQQQQVQAQPMPSQPQSYRQVPVGYFRTYTYQPMSFQPAQYSPYQSYQVSAARLSANPWQRQISAPHSISPGYMAAPSQIVQHSITPPATLPTTVTSPTPAPSSTSTPSTTTIFTTTAPAPEVMRESPPSMMMMGPPQMTLPPPMAPMIRPSPQIMASPDPYISNIQHVQFVPCMCPVTVTVSGGSDAADKRSDDLSSNDLNDSIAIIAEEN